MQLAYKFGELVEVHAADTYAEFVEANEVRADSWYQGMYNPPCVPYPVSMLLSHIPSGIHTLPLPAGPVEEAAPSGSGTGVLQGKPCLSTRRVSTCKRMSSAMPELPSHLREHL